MPIMLCAPCRSKSSGCRAIAPIPQFDLLLLPLSAELFRGWQRSRGGRLAAPRRPAAAAQQGGGAAGLWRGAQTVQKAREVRCKKDPCISTHCELGCIRVITRMHPSYRACERHVAHSKGLPACWLAAGCWPAPRLAHEHTRAEHARHARTTRVRLASDAHALTLQHALTSRQKSKMCA